VYRVNQLLLTVDEVFKLSVCFIHSLQYFRPVLMRVLAAIERILCWTSVCLAYNV